MKKKQPKVQINFRVTPAVDEALDALQARLAKRGGHPKVTKTEALTVAILHTENISWNEALQMPALLDLLGFVRQDR